MARFFTLQVVRFAGVFAAGFGALLWRTRAIGGSPDPATGQVLFVAGLLLAVVVPALLRRRWRSGNGSTPR